MGKFKERNRVLIFGESATNPRAENGVTTGISGESARQVAVTADNFTEEERELIRKYRALDARTQNEITDRINCEYEFSGEKISAEVIPPPEFGGKEISMAEILPPASKPMYSPFVAAQIEELLQAPPLPLRIMSTNENKLCHVLLDFKFGEEQIAWLLADPQFQAAIFSTYNKMLSDPCAAGKEEISDDKTGN